LSSKELFSKKKILELISITVAVLTIITAILTIKQHIDSCKETLKKELEFYEQLDGILDRSKERFIEFLSRIDEDKNCVFSYIHLSLKGKWKKDLLNKTITIDLYRQNKKNIRIFVKVINHPKLKACNLTLYKVGTIIKANIPGSYTVIHPIIADSFITDNKQSKIIIPSKRFFYYLRRFSNCNQIRFFLEKSAKLILKGSPIKKEEDPISTIVRIDLAYRILKIPGKYRIVGFKETDKETVFTLLKSEDLRIIKEWSIRLRSTFKDIHNQMEKLIMKNQYFIDKDPEMKAIINQLLRHIDGYKRVFKKWEMGDYSELTSDVNFPSEINSMVKRKISLLKKKLNSFSLCW